jgi:hypothetical protein
MTFSIATFVDQQQEEQLFSNFDPFHSCVYSLVGVVHFYIHNGDAITNCMYTIYSFYMHFFAIDQSVDHTLSDH